MGLQRIMVFADHFLTQWIIGIIKRAVFTDHTVDGPKASDHITPACWAPGNRGNANAGVVQIFQRRIGLCGQAPFGGYCVINIGKYDLNTGRHLMWHFCDSAHC